MVARWLTTLSDPFHTLSDPSASPCNPADHPVPSTDSPAPVTCSYSPIQAHTPPIAFTRRKQASGGLRSGRTDADSMPIPPPGQKNDPPYPVRKKKICSELRAPVWGKTRPRSEGKPSRNATPKTGTVGSKGTGVCRLSRVLALAPVIPGSCVIRTAGKVQRSHGRSRLLSTQEIKKDLFVLACCRYLCRCARVDAVRSFVNGTCWAGMAERKKYRYERGDAPP